jgi:hypothetical protein
LLRCERQAHSITKLPAPVNSLIARGQSVGAIKELLLP